MRNYIHADIKRILTRASHTLSMLLIFGIYALYLYMGNRGNQVTAVSLINSACSTLGLMILLVGLFEMIGVFSEDLKVKTMQAAIGLGVTRNKVVFCKLAEVVILLVLDMMALLAITLGVGGLFGISVPMIVLKDLIYLLLVQCVIGCTVYTGITMIVLFATHSTVLSIFVYVLVGIDAINLLLEFLPMMGLEWIEPLHLNHFTISHFANLLDTRLALGSFDIPAFLGLAAYLAVGVFAACRIFARRELEF